MPPNNYSGVSEKDDAAARKIHQAVLSRKAKQKTPKAQPWLGFYVPSGDDIPMTTSPHDKPWLKSQSNATGGEGNASDTDAGKT
ncbi:hypothetical protein N7493_008290 [Penicillium malachiteum]|uniref:Uncharacterized protein n=1 Tax=Penicillium malachiteum TaxID=1324776 RepID=A0AAD6MTK6_9EURO|nr:hypothetical protein N7493_008290 [Penicillium malachiteum]